MKAKLLRKARRRTRRRISIEVDKKGTYWLVGLTYRYCYPTLKMAKNEYRCSILWEARSIFGNKKIKL